jgi:hypothetical protein
MGERDDWSQNNVKRKVTLPFHPYPVWVRTCLLRYYLASPCDKHTFFYIHITKKALLAPNSCFFMFNRA